MGTTDQAELSGNRPKVVACGTGGTRQLFIFLSSLSGTAKSLNLPAVAPVRGKSEFSILQGKGPLWLQGREALGLNCLNWSVFPELENCRLSAFNPHQAG